MKKYIPIAGLLVCLFLLHTGRAQTKPSIAKSTKQTTLAPEDRLARQLFLALKTNDQQLWQSLYPTNEEYKELMDLMLAHKMPGLTVEKANAMVLQQQKEAPTAYAKDFRKYRKQADSAGIQWTKAVYKDFIFVPDQAVKIPRKYINGDIWCRINKMEFVIEGIEAVETPGGYRLQSIQGIRLIEDSY